MAQTGQRSKGMEEDYIGSQGPQRKKTCIHSISRQYSAAVGRVHYSLPRQVATEYLCQVYSKPELRLFV